MRTHLPFIAILPLIAAFGCGMNQPSPTVYVTVPQSPAKATDVDRPKNTQPAKPTELAKPSDPWEEARAYFKKVKETEKEATETKLLKLDKSAESQTRTFMQAVPIDTPRDLRDEVTYGQELLAAGFNEFVEARSAATLDNEKFVAVFRKLNPSPTTREVINAAVRFATWHRGYRQTTIDAIEKGGDTRDSPETHKAATAWTGK